MQPGIENPFSESKKTADDKSLVGEILGEDLAEMMEDTKESSDQSTESRETRNPLQERVRDGPGVLGGAIRIHDRHVPDQHRRAQPPQSSRRRLYASCTGAGDYRVLPPSRLLRLQRGRS